MATTAPAAALVQIDFIGYPPPTGPEIGAIGWRLNAPSAAFVASGPQSSEQAGIADPQALSKRTASDSIRERSRTFASLIPMPTPASRQARTFSWPALELPSRLDKDGLMTRSLNIRGDLSNPVMDWAGWFFGSWPWD